MDEPIVRISNDASMAWMITRTSVRRVQKKADGAEQEEKFVYAGIMTYAVRGRTVRREAASLRVGLGKPAPRFGKTEKRDGRWVRVANVSTFEQPN